MKDWERAELWARRISERYPGSVRVWLSFCERTGHGDIAAARDLVKQFAAAVGEPEVAAVDRGQQPADDLEIGYSSWLQGATKEAMESLRKAYDASTRPLLSGCSLLVLADERGDAAQRDAILDDLCARHRAKAPLMFDVLEMFRDPFARGGRALPDLKALARAVEAVKPNARGNTEFYVGWLLRKRGARQDAEAYLKRCIETGTTNAWLKRIAGAALRPKNGDSVPATAGQPLPKAS